MSELILKENPVGIDTVINNINNLVFNELDWLSSGDNPVNYKAYHRALKNPRNGGVIPEVYEIDTNNRTGEYTEGLYDDDVDASSFFYVADEQNPVDNGMLFNTTISMVFQVDLSVVADNIDHRGDAEIHRVVVNAINKGLYGQVSSLVTGIPNVYSEFDQSQIEFTDMHPFHCFRVDVDVNYQFDCCKDGCGLHRLDTSFLQTVSGGFILLVDGGKIIIN
tara:strand:+ start:6101 stop:6763 length:663 start_codon:yes stop_codon:yes gene_type:complete